MTFSMVMWAFSFFCFGASVALLLVSQLVEIRVDQSKVNDILRGYVINLSGEVEKRDKALVKVCGYLGEKTGLSGKTLYHSLMEGEKHD